MDLAGRYFDGRSAATHEATARFGEAAVEIVLAGGETVRWPVDALRLDGRPRPGTPVRLVRAGEAEALVVDDPALGGWLAGHPVPQLRPAAGQRRLAWIAAGAIAALAAFAVAWTTGGPAVLAGLIPLSWERQIGARVVDELRTLLSAVEQRPIGRCTAPAGAAALQRLVDRLARASGSDHHFAVTVIDSRTVNALTAPGGHVLVLRGLVDFARGPDEFAGVLAHEMGHVIHRDVTRSVIRNAGLSTLIGLATGGAAGGGTASLMARVLVSTAYGRAAEDEADATAARILAAAGIGSDGLAQFFERLARTHEMTPGPLQMFSTHPPSADRGARLRAGDGVSPRPAMTAADWRALKAICAPAPSRS